jgi:hypothetical protein
MSDIVHCWCSLMLLHVVPEYLVRFIVTPVVLKFHAYGTRKFMAEFWKVRWLITFWAISSSISVAANNLSSLVRGMGGQMDVWPPALYPVNFFSNCLYICKACLNWLYARIQVISCHCTDRFVGFCIDINCNTWDGTRDLLILDQYPYHSAIRACQKWSIRCLFHVRLPQMINKIDKA